MKLRLPETKFFYDLAMKRSAEIKAGDPLDDEEDYLFEDGGGESDTDVDEDDEDA